MPVFHHNRMCQLSSFQKTRGLLILISVRNGIVVPQQHSFCVHLLIIFLRLFGFDAHGFFVSSYFVRISDLYFTRTLSTNHMRHGAKINEELISVIQGNASYLTVSQIAIPIWSCKFVCVVFGSPRYESDNVIVRFQLVCQFSEEVTSLWLPFTFTTDIYNAICIIVKDPTIKAL